MRKEDVKSILLIFFILLLISAISILGINVYLNVINKSQSDAPLYEGNIVTTPDKNNTNTNNTNNTIVVEHSDDILNQVTSAGQNTQTANSNTYADQQNGYYYNQLNDYSKIIYDALKNNKENLKTGTYKLEFNNVFDKLLSTEGGTELLQSYYQSAMETYLYDNPDIFYLDPNKMYINIRTIKKIFSTTYEVFIDCGNNSNYFTKDYTSKQQIVEYENQINKEVQKILSLANGKSDYQKIQIVHDYLIDSITYESSISKPNIYNIYGALVNKESVCEGYAKAFKHLMNNLNIECIIVTGYAIDSKGESQSHAWNYIKLNNEWYAVDVTWDDPIIIGGGTASDKHKYKYFLKGKNTMDADHIVSFTFVDNGKQYTHPNLNERDYV